MRSFPLSQALHLSSNADDKSSVSGPQRVIGGVVPRHPFQLDHSFETFQSKRRHLRGIEDSSVIRAVAPLLSRLVDLLGRVISPVWETLECAQSRWYSKVSCAAMVIASMEDLIAEVTAGWAQLNLQKLVSRSYDPFSKSPYFAGLY